MFVKRWVRFVYDKSFYLRGEVQLRWSDHSKGKCKQQQEDNSIDGCKFESSMSQWQCKIELVDVRIEIFDMEKEMRKSLWLIFDRNIESLMKLLNPITLKNCLRKFQQNIQKQMTQIFVLILTDICFLLVTCSKSLNHFFQKYFQF